MTKIKSPEDEAAAESYEFQAEVSKLLHLMVHSVYSETEVFLRELISNAADACDKLRYAGITEPALIGDEADLKIAITVDPDAKQILIADNGIGMSHDELIENLGTIARSGTEAFIDQLAGKDTDLQLIGQFGVGFYSAFMVAGEVDVLSRRAGSDEAWKWTSDGSGKFTLEQLDAASDETPARGTVIRLHLREDAGEYADRARVENIVRTYSDHISFPIILNAPAEGDEDAEEPRQLNSASALWTRPKSEISEEQYKEFYGHVAGLYDEPALTVHYKAEGRHEYTVLLFVPGQRPFDLFDPERLAKLKLYVRRVFITDDASILPGYLRFARGVIDSEDMPLNISREMLQNNPIVAAIRKAVTNRLLSELEKTADKDPDTYKTIWSNFGPVLKEGLYEDMERRDQLFSLARFRTTTEDDGQRSLKDYVAAMKDSQTAIYYVTGEDAEKALASPQLEGFRAKDDGSAGAVRPGRQFLDHLCPRLRRQAVQVGDAGRGRSRRGRRRGRRRRRRGSGRDRTRHPDRPDQADPRRRRLGRAQISPPDRQCRVPCRGGRRPRSKLGEAARPARFRGRAQGRAGPGNQPQA